MWWAKCVLVIAKIIGLEDSAITMNHVNIIEGYRDCVTHDILINAVTKMHLIDSHKR